ncbi:MAG TPA: hypothetical protein VFK02_09135, partial [Kofleriaceae bacterium]|nr:hypothetical protein [Kofleriaceae bacterium]
MTAMRAGVVWRACGAHAGLAVLAVLAVVGTAACGRARPDDRAGDRARMLDAFEDLAAWRATGSEGVTAAIHGVPGVRGAAMRLAFDLAGTSGYAVARRALPLDLPPDFELTLELRGEAPVNNLELKLIDDTGDNVWWYRRADLAFPAAWRHVTVRRRQITFAWGPIADHTLRHIAAIELVVSAGKGGGKGTLEIDELALRALPPVTGPAPAPTATASSEEPG